MSDSLEELEKFIPKEASQKARDMMSNAKLFAHDVDDFLESNFRDSRRWIKCGDHKVYLRKENFQGKKALTIASWECDLFPRNHTEFIMSMVTVVDDINPFDFTIIETPGDRALIIALLAAGWKETTVKDHGVVGNLFLEKSKEAMQERRWRERYLFYMEDESEQ